MAHTDVSRALFDGLVATLDVWFSRFDGEGDPLYWLLRVKAAETRGDATVDSILEQVPEPIRDDVAGYLEETARYWDNIRYATLDRVTQLWGTVVNAVRVAAESEMSTPRQREVFDFPAESCLAFFRAARERMQVADALHHAFKPMPAPECQALAALLNVHVEAPLDVDLMCRLVRLLDQEGPLSESESADLDTLSNTSLVDAAFRGLRGHA
jgi:hypothetical protein